MTGALGLSHHYLKILTIRLSRTQIRIGFFLHTTYNSGSENLDMKGYWGKKSTSSLRKVITHSKKKKLNKIYVRAIILLPKLPALKKLFQDRDLPSTEEQKNILERLLLQPTNIPPTKCKDAPKKKSIYSAANPTKIPSGELHVPEMGESPGNAVWGSQVPPGEIQCWNWKRI